MQDNTTMKLTEVTMSEPTAREALTYNNPEAKFGITPSAVLTIKQPMEPKTATLTDEQIDDLMLATGTYNEDASQETILTWREAYRRAEKETNDQIEAAGGIEQWYESGQGRVFVWDDEDQEGEWEEWDGLDEEEQLSNNNNDDDDE